MIEIKDERRLRVIISDVEFRKSFDVVNIMRNHYQYECILCSNQPKNRILSLIYGQKVVPLRHDCYDDFSRDLQELITRFNDSRLVYLPVSNKSIALFYQFLNRNPTAPIAYQLPPEKYFHLANDKIRFQEFCEAHRFPVPKHFNREDASGLSEAALPLILKPKSGEGSVGIKHLEHPEDLQVLNEVDFNEYILQEKILSDQNIVGGFFLCRGGEVLNAHTHRRIRTFPTNGGVTVYSESGQNADVIQIGTRVLKEMEWDGLAMIEFLFDQKRNRWVIIELNPRIWGSVMLSAYNESDLLKGYVELSCGRLPAKTQPKHVYIRWLFPFDLLNFLRRDLSWREFVKWNRKETCYINMTYASWLRSIAYLTYFTLNPKSIQRFFKKLR